MKKPIGPKRTIETILFAAILVFAGDAHLSADDGAGPVNPAAPCPAAAPNRAVGDVINSFSAPGLGDLRGLTFDGQYLWMAEDDGKTIHKINPLTGAEVATIPTPGSAFTQGLAWDGTSLWHAEYNGIVYELDPANGAILSSFAAPTVYPCGLTWDGTHLWTASYREDMIFQMTTAGGLVNSFPAPAGDGWGVAFDGNSLWHGQFNAGLIYELDPTDGTVRSSFPTPAYSHCLGLTFDGKYLWTTNNNYDQIHQLDAGLSTDPILDVKLDGHDGPITISSTQQVMLTISLQPEGMAGANMDWWVVAQNTSGGLYSWVYSLPWHWTNGLRRAYAGPLIPITNYTLRDGTIPAATWTINFAVDARDNTYQGTYVGAIEITSM